MKPRLQPRAITRIDAFSLTEVMFAIGVVAALMLPALAMLAGGGSMQMIARDRDTASRIARIVTSGIYAAESGDQFKIDFSETDSIRVPLPGSGGAEAVYAAFDKEGRLLREISEAEFRNGADLTGTAVHLLSLRLSGAMSDPRMLELSLSVQQPASAAEADREKEPFQTRLAIP